MLIILFQIEEIFAGKLGYQSVEQKNIGYCAQTVSDFKISIKK